MGFADQAHSRWDDVINYLWPQAGTAASTFQQYYRPAIGQAFRAAKSAGNTPALYSGMQTANRNLEGDLARSGLQNTGTAFAQRKNQAAQFNQQAAETQMRAKLAQSQAMQSLAGSVGAGYGNTVSPLLSATNSITNVDLQRDANQQAQDAAQSAAIGQGVGMVGSLAGMALGGPMGATAGGMLGSGLAGMATGGQTGGYSTVNKPTAPLTAAEQYQSDPTFANYFGVGQPGLGAFGQYYGIGQPGLGIWGDQMRNYYLGRQ